MTHITHLANIAEAHRSWTAGGLKAEATISNIPLLSVFRNIFAQIIMYCYNFFFIISHFLWSPLEGVRSSEQESCTFALIYIYGYGVFPVSMDIYLFLSLYFCIFLEGDARGSGNLCSFRRFFELQKYI